MLPPFKGCTCDACDWPCHPSLWLSPHGDHSPSSLLLSEGCTCDWPCHPSLWLSPHGDYSPSSLRLSEGCTCDWPCLPSLWLSPHGDYSPSSLFLSRAVLVTGLAFPPCGSVLMDTTPHHLCSFLRAALVMSLLPFWKGLTSQPDGLADCPLTLSCCLLLQPWAV
jgi:hypothetical protein